MIKNILYCTEDNKSTTCWSHRSELCQRFPFWWTSQLLLPFWILLASWSNSWRWRSVWQSQEATFQIGVTSPSQSVSQYCLDSGYYPGGPVVKIPCSYYRGHIPGQGTKIPYAVWHAPPQKKSILPWFSLGISSIICSQITGILAQILETCLLCLDGVCGLKNMNSG